MNAGRSDVSFFVYCLRVVDVFNDDNFFAQTEVTMFNYHQVCMFCIVSQLSSLFLAQILFHCFYSVHYSI